MSRRSCFSLMMALCLAGFVGALHARTALAAEIRFTAEYLNDPANIGLGKKLWAKRCARCHGKAAYPGSAPKLRPKRYQPEFVYDRITNGFRGMPALKTEFSQEERQAIVAYVKSPGFRE
ncbi:MAG: c-type cytochrome [Candidatus Tectomicrobia bacterium]|nr:c-type cytochrome [Candidatus Tectomicrobia bacterium]